MAPVPGCWDAALTPDAVGIDGLDSTARVAHSPIWAAPATLTPDLWHTDIAPRCKNIASSPLAWQCDNLWDAYGEMEIPESTEKKAVFQIPPLGLSPFIVDHDHRQAAQLQIESKTVAHAPEGVVGARRLSSRAVQLNMTLLVAGFIIGTRGASIRAIVYLSGANISSCTRISRGLSGRMIRVFHIKGAPASISFVVKIMLLAVERYKELSEGKYKGMRVSASQIVEGVEFTYRPPPKGRVPHAAAIDFGWHNPEEQTRRSIQT